MHVSFIVFKWHLISSCSLEVVKPYHARKTAKSLQKSLIHRKIEMYLQLYNKKQSYHDHRISFISFFFFFFMMYKNRTSWRARWLLHPSSIFILHSFYSYTKFKLNRYIVTDNNGFWTHGVTSGVSGNPWFYIQKTQSIFIHNNKILFFKAWM